MSAETGARRVGHLAEAAPREPGPPAGPTRSPTAEPPGREQRSGLHHWHGTGTAGIRLGCSSWGGLAKSDSRHLPPNPCPRAVYRIPSALSTPNPVSGRCPGEGQERW